MAGSFNSMRSSGNSSMKGGRLGNGVSRFGGSGGGKKQIINSSANDNCGINGVIGRGESSSDVGRFRAQSPWNSAGKSPWAGWGQNFKNAVLGKKRLKSVDNLPTENKHKQRLPQGILDMKIKADAKVKPGDIKYNYRKNVLSINEEEGIDRKALPKRLIKIAESSQRFRSTTGIGKVSQKDRSILQKSLKRKRLKVERANRQLLSSATKRSSTKSSSRKVTFGDLIK